MDKRLLYTLLKNTKEKTVEVIKTQLKAEYFLVEGEFFILAIPTNPIPICLVAHYDTVDDTNTERELIIRGDIIQATNTILGADDRAGCFALLQLAKQKYNGKQPYLLFTDFEECGGLGAREFTEGFKQLGIDINLFIELDRQGANDYVYYNPLPTEVADYIESYGFIEDFGSYSDIKTITEGTKIPSVNLSIGYYNQHTKHEFLHMAILKSTIKRVADILSNPIDKLYPVDEFEHVCNYPFSYIKYTDDRLLPDDSEKLEVLEELDYVDALGRCTFCNRNWKNCICGNVAEGLHIYETEFFQW